jgi:DeoR family deoxyribose operon repressor
METRRDDRIAQLLQALKRSDKLHLKEAANLLGVSEMTIRRDLNSESAPSCCWADTLCLSRVAPAII